MIICAVVTPEGNKKKTYFIAQKKIIIEKQGKQINEIKLKIPLYIEKPFKTIFNEFCFGIKIK